MSLFVSLFYQFFLKTVVESVGSDQVKTAVSKSKVAGLATAAFGVLGLVTGHADPTTAAGLITTGAYAIIDRNSREREAVTLAEKAARVGN